MGTSPSQLDRVLDHAYIAVQLDTLIKAARPVDRMTDSPGDARTADSM